MMQNFPVQVRIFATWFVHLQSKRHAADYDPDGKYYKSAVQSDILATRSAMMLFVAAPIRDRRAFAAWVLFKERND